MWFFPRGKHETSAARHFACGAGLFLGDGKDIPRAHPVFNPTARPVDQNGCHAFPYPVLDRQQPIFIYAKNARPRTKAGSGRFIFVINAEKPFYIL